jgi:hypothetical protein
MRLKKKLNGVAVLWVAGDADGFGRRTHAAPVQVRCRWDQSQRRFADAGTGEIAVSRATVLLERQVVAGDRLRRVALADLDSSSEGPYATGTWEVRAAEQNQDVRGGYSLWMAYL